MKHRDSSPDPVAGQDDRDRTPVHPDYARGPLEQGRSTGSGELGEPNFATTDIDPAEPDPNPAETPNFATTNIDPAEADPIDPHRPNFATRDQDLS